MPPSKSSGWSRSVARSTPPRPDGRTIPGLTLVAFRRCSASRLPTGRALSTSSLTGLWGDGPTARLRPDMINGSVGNITFVAGVEIRRKWRWNRKHAAYRFTHRNAVTSVAGGARVHRLTRGRLISAWGGHG